MNAKRRVERLKNPEMRFSADKNIETSWIKVLQEDDHLQRT